MSVPQGEFFGEAQPVLVELAAELADSPWADVEASCQGLGLLALGHLDGDLPVAAAEPGQAGMSQRNVASRAGSWSGVSHRASLNGLASSVLKSGIFPT